jgi:peptide/nickel transport system substrate-binding protein
VASALSALIQVSAQAVKGPATDTIVIQRVSLDEAIQALQSGRIDAYLFSLSLRPAQAEIARRDPNKRILSAPAGLVDFIFIPAPVYIANLSGDQTRRSLSDLARLTGGSPTAIVNVYYDKDRDATFIEYGAYPGKGANPFAFKDVRIATNYLVDRDNIVNVIYRGLHP